MQSVIGSNQRLPATASARATAAAWISFYFTGTNAVVATASRALSQQRSQGVGRKN